MKQKLLQNLLAWFRASRPVENVSAGWERGELAKLNQELWTYRAVRLDRQIAKFNLKIPIDAWLSNTAGVFPHGRIRVLAVPFNTVSSDKYSPAERLFYAGAFSSLTGDVQANIKHDRSKVFARYREGSLKLDKDSRGLWLTALLTGEHGGAALQKIKSGELCGASIEHDPDCDYFVADSPRRVVHILNCEIVGVALTQSPAFSQTIGTIILEEKPMFETTLMLASRATERRHGQHDANLEIEHRHRIAAEAKRVLAAKKCEAYPGQLKVLWELLRLAEIE